MVSKKVWGIMNVSLALFALVLLLTFLDVQVPTLGQAQYNANPNDPYCVVEWGNTMTLFEDLDRCCLEAVKQLSCDRVVDHFGNEEIHWDCHTGNSVHYKLNNKAYGYCAQQPVGIR
ncbi:TPA: hypothetical protein HA278_02715 [Candidatus Woesearchaeota archaeon]|nr:hypothetical protein [Candidatus Woesearchaeota archaeon]